jgi:hypothetical protein
VIPVAAKDDESPASSDEKSAVKGKVSTAAGVSLHQNEISDRPVEYEWILLDNQSTLDVFSNPNLLTNIRESERSMTIHCNAGKTTTSQVGNLDGYGTVWYNPSGIANILSLSCVISNGYVVQYDSQNGNEFVLRGPNGHEIKFKQSEQGLYYVNGATVGTGTLFVNTVADNRSRYSSREYARAATARRLQQTMGCPSTRDFVDMVSRNLLPNCPVTVQDIKTAEDIFGPDLGSLRGKTVRRGGTHVEASTVSIPRSIITDHQRVVLCADVMTVNKIPFFVTISRKIKFGTVEAIKNMKNSTLTEAILQVKRVYAKRGFIIDTMLLDGQFESLRNTLAGHGIHTNVTSANEHVPEIERRIRTIKERVQCMGRVTVSENAGKNDH